MNFIISSIVGGATGVLASMGLGGGFILMVYLALFTNIPQKSSGGINLLFFIPVSLLAIIFNIKNKMIDVKICLICSLYGVVTCVIGFYIAQQINNNWLRKGFAIFIILMGIKDLFTKKTTPNP